MGSWRPFCAFFLSGPATTEIYTLSLHDALPILHQPVIVAPDVGSAKMARGFAKRLDASLAIIDKRRPSALVDDREDRKSTRLNSSHITISYAVFCLKKKNEIFGLAGHVDAHKTH